jgi:predicted transcriptional regulator
MTATLTNANRLTLQAETAADLMTGNPISVRDKGLVADAVVLLTRKGFHAAPVIDESGRPVGVLSYTDVLVHERARREAGSAGFDEARVCELMTPAVFSVPVNAPAGRVVREMVALNVHQLYVVDPAGVLVGVITALDVLRRLGD